MFSQKKKNRSWIYLVIILVIAVILVFVLIGALSNRNKSENEDLQRTNLEQKVEEQVPAEKVPPKGLEEEPADSEEIEFFQSYYLVKYDNNDIKIYFSDETGKLTELEATTIVYETLSTEDQQRFKEGIKVDSRDNLNKLIMDYES